MLQRNAIAAPHRAHVAHAAVVGLHAICCGVPAAAMLAAGLAGAASGVVLLSDFLGLFHRWLHGYEVWVFGLSTGLVALGAWLELDGWRRGRSTGFPWLFAFSVLCLLVNVGVLLAHRS